MKKILSILASVALVLVILAAGVFGYKSIKALNDSKKNHKTELSKKDKKKDDKKEEVVQQEQVAMNNESNNEEGIKELNLEEEIAKADKNEDGIATTDEMTPELEILTAQRAFQPVSPEMNDAEAHKKYELSDEEEEKAI